jgi:hypothetical protein
MNLGGIFLLTTLLFAACQNPTEEEKEYTVTITGDTAKGRVIPVPEKAEEGTKVVLIAAPAVYYVLAEAPLVSAGNTEVVLSGDGQSEPYSFTMPAANVTVRPSFVLHTSHNIWPVYNADDLALIGNDEAYPMNGIYQLQNDITLPADWAPIGDGSRVFSGILDGNGKTITVGTYLYEDDDGPLPYTGIFGFIIAANIKNLTLNLNQVKVEPQGVDFGFLVGYATYSELQNIALTGDFEINLDNGTQYNVGAIAGVLDHSQLQHGSLEGKLTVSRRNADINPESTFINNIGGVAGLVTSSSIRECAVNGDIDIASLFMRAGGIVGTVEQSVMTGNSVTGNVSGVSINNFDGYAPANSYIHIGGLAGSFSSGNMTDGVFDGDLLVDLSGSATGGNNTTAYAGGVIGNIVQEANANNLFFNGDIKFKMAGSMTSRNCAIGGIVGYSNSGQITNSSFEGDINVVDNLTATAQASHYIATGGILGTGSSGTTVKTCHTFGVITATNEDDSGVSIGAITRTYTGGIVGYLSLENEINSCYYTGSVTSIGVYSYAGGIAGYSNTSSASEIKIIQCYALLENVTAKGSGIKPATNPENSANAPLRISAGGIVGRTYITSNDSQHQHSSAVEYCAALLGSANSFIKAEGDTDTIFAGSIVGNRNTINSGTTMHPGGILTSNITNIPATAITPYAEDTSVEDASMGKNGNYLASVTQESFFGSTENGGLGWDAAVWTWDSVNSRPRLSWQQN